MASPPRRLGHGPGSDARRRRAQDVHRRRVVRRGKRRHLPRAEPGDRGDHRHGPRRHRRGHAPRDRRGAPGVRRGAVAARDPRRPRPRARAHRRRHGATQGRAAPPARRRGRGGLRHPRDPARAADPAPAPLCRARAHVRLRGGAAPPREPGADGAAAQLGHRLPSAGGRVRPHSYLELPALRRRPEARAGARHRLHDGLQAVAEADLPPGVVNFVTGQSTAIAEALVADARIDKVSFTGSVATGKKIMEAAAKTLKRVHLELGGKSVGIYLDTNNLEMHAMIAAGPAMFHAGQGCAMSTRVLVPRDVHDAFVEKMVGFVTGMVTIGDPADPGTMLGPVIREERRAKIEEYIAAGKAEGARLACGGGRPKHLPRGYFLEPTIFAEVPNHIRIAREEIFGPVVAVIPFKDEDEAVRIANDSTYGLGGAIYSRDTARAIELAKRIRTGVVWINNGINMIDGPFGGFKESGLGREGGRWGVEEYTEVQQITWRT